MAMTETEADTCRRHVVPKLQAAGWDTEPHSIAEQRSITDGRTIPAGRGFVRKSPKRVDFLPRPRRDFPLAVVEAKASYRTAADAVQQARLYAEMLGLKFAYATNGHGIIEIDYLTGTETPRADYPTPAELWSRYRAGAGLADDGAAERLLTPSNHRVGMRPRPNSAPSVGSRFMAVTVAPPSARAAVGSSRATAVRWWSTPE